MRKHAVIDVTTCPNCDRHTLERREHKNLDLVRHHHVYYLEWDTCTTCGYVFYDPDYRVTPSGQVAMV